MLRLLASLLAILGAGGHHAARLSVSEPRPFEVWDGRLAGRAGAPFHIRAGGRRYTSHPGLAGRFSVRVPHVAAGDTAVTRGGPPDPGLRAAARLASPTRPGADDRGSTGRSARWPPA